MKPLTVKNFLQDYSRIVVPEPSSGSRRILLLDLIEQHYSHIREECLKRVGIEVIRKPL